MKASQSYTDRAGIDARANSALLAIEAMLADRRIPAAVRLALVARRLGREPIFTDTAPAACTVRKEAAQYANTWWPE